MFPITPEMIEELRRRNIAPPPVPVQDEQPLRMVSPMSEDAQTDRPAFDGYREHLQSMPTREESTPSFGRKALSGVVGALHSAASHDVGAGVQTAEHLRDARYNNSLADWSRQGAGKKALVDLENDDSHLQLQRVRALNDAAYKEGQLHNTGRRTDAQIEHYGDQRDNWRRTDENADLDRGVRADHNRATENYQGRVAATGERNASTNEQRAETDAQRGEDYGRSVDLRASRSNKKAPSPAAQKTAREEAMRDAVAKMPAYKRFVDEETLTFKPPEEEWFDFNGSAPKEEEEYNEFRKMIRDGVAARTGGWVPDDLDDENDDDEDDKLGAGI